MLQYRRVEDLAVGDRVWFAGGPWVVLAVLPLPDGTYLVRLARPHQSRRRRALRADGLFELLTVSAPAVRP